MSKERKAKVFEVVRYAIDGGVVSRDYVAAESAKAIKAALVSVKLANRGTLDRMAITGERPLTLVIPVEVAKGE